ncbi:MAG TPA: hypothetical protein PLM07_16960 [Candidatus Rifleibacterium sp.]|nr:hypothetical protein [Candidatus Rifleibacterium sp.]HPT47576.1 hypothetical protein [Candidatus Rifleibacterium sp.]
MVAKKALTLLSAVIFLLAAMTSVAFAQIDDADGLLVDIPEPPGARSELPTPIPMVYEFMGGLMAGEFDICLANFDVQTFLDLLFDRQLKRLDPEEARELFSFQIQTQRNEFRFLSKVMNRVAAGAKIDYSNPRYHKQVQSKVVIKIDTTRGKFDFIVYCRFIKDRWFIYDYVLNNQRLTQTFRDALKGIGIDNYVASLRPFYGEKRGFRPVRNKNYEFSYMVPSEYLIRENISPALLSSVGAFDGQFLLHVQGAEYDEPQNLTQVGKAIKESLMPFQPRLFDQWKSELAGVEIGNVLFHFLKNNKRLYTHMVLIPLGRKLVVLNFYHSSLQLMKHMTNLREKILETLSLPKIEAAGGVLPGEIPDELTVAGGNEFGEIDSNQEPAFQSSDEITINPEQPGQPGQPEPPAWESNPEPPGDEPAAENGGEELRPDSFTGNDSDYPEPPEPDANDTGDEVGDDVPPPPEPPADDATPTADATAPANPDNSGNGSNIDDDDYYPGPEEGGDVSF